MILCVFQVSTEIYRDITVNCYRHSSLVDWDVGRKYYAVLPETYLTFHFSRR
jgi:hypothetical protein